VIACGSRYRVVVQRLSAQAPATRVHAGVVTFLRALCGYLRSLRLWVKTLDRLDHDDNDNMTRHHPLGGIVVELRTFRSRSDVIDGQARIASRGFSNASAGCSCGLVSYTRELVFANLCPSCLLAGSTLYGSKREGGQLS
jgi:hypothetical protein